jgi:hypothetical protein
MKKLYAYCSIVFTLSFSQHAISQCTPSYGTGCSFGDRIEFFSLKGDNSTVLYNQSGTTCNSSPLAFSNFTALTTVDLAIGKSFSGKIFTSGSSNYATIWIDFNNNNFFEDGERLLHNLALTQLDYTAYSIFVPNASALGSHRMRVRLVYTATPNTLTDPCDFFTWGETEDYTVNIINTPSAGIVFNGTAGSCHTSCATTINTASNNASATNIALIDTNNHYIVGLYPNGNNLGRVTASAYIHNGPVRTYANGVYYLDRNITINTQTNPIGNYNARFYYRNAELNTLIAQPGSGVTSQFDMATTVRNEVCLSAAGASAGGVLQYPTGFGSIGGDRFFDFSSLATVGSFYFHGGTTPLPLEGLQFTATRRSNAVLINWKMENASTVVSYTLQKSNDGIRFNEIALITTNPTNQYQYTDTYIASENSYYRLQLIHADGSKKQSEVRLVKKQSNFNMTIYPNPVKEQLQIMLDVFETNHLTVLISDASGKVLIQKKATTINGNNSIILDVAGLHKGMYFIKVLGNNINSNSSFIKQ